MGFAGIDPCPRYDDVSEYMVCGRIVSRTLPLVTTTLGCRANQLVSLVVKRTRLGTVKGRLAKEMTAATGASAFIDSIIMVMYGASGALGVQERATMLTSAARNPWRAVAATLT